MIFEAPSSVELISLKKARLQKLIDSFNIVPAKILMLYLTDLEKNTQNFIGNKNKK